MKKLLAIILMGIMVLSLCACGYETDSDVATSDKKGSDVSAPITEEDAVRNAILETRSRTWQKELDASVKGGILTKEKAEEYSKIDPVIVHEITIDGNKATAECETFAGGETKADEWAYRKVEFELEKKDGKWVIYKTRNVLEV